MTAPVPTVGQASEDMRAIETALDTLEGDYRMLHDLATTPGSRHTARATAGRVTGSGSELTRTEASAAEMMGREKAYIRRRTTQIARKIGQARKRLEEARDLADEVFERDDPKTAVPRGGAAGSFLEPGQLRDSERAQARRRGRGDL